MTSSEPTAQEALDALAHARELAEAAVRDTADPHEAFRLATELTTAFREASDHIAQQRGQAAVRIRDQEALSLRGLADKLGVSGARAAQLVKQANAREAVSHE